MKRNISYYFFPFLSILLILMYWSLQGYIRTDYEATEGPAMSIVAGISIIYVGHYVMNSYLKKMYLHKR